MAEIPPILRSLTDAELAKIKPLSDKEIAEALERGRQEAEAARQARGIQIPKPGRRYR